MFRTLLRAAPFLTHHLPRVAMSGAVVAMFHLACVGNIGDTRSSSGGTGHGGSNPTGGSSGGSPTGGFGVGGGPGNGPLDPGHLPLRRLNRTEYCNTVHDLLGTAQRPCDRFPDDPINFGFDTIADVQSVSGLHIELYEAATTALVDEVMNLPATDARRTRIMTCQPAAADPKPCVTNILRAFAERAYRRPVAPAEVIDQVGLLDVAKAQMGTVDDGIRLGLRAILLSPNFLFRVEIDPNPNSTDVHPVGPYELATRLSYSLWSTMPDDALLASAANGSIQTPAELDRQVTRMMQDARAHAITTDFVGQWLGYRDMPSVDVNAMSFPTFDPALRDAMAGESERFFDEFIRSQAPASDMLTANYTYLNARLAQHYGMTAPPGTDFARVSLAGTNRSGILMQGSFLTLTSYPNRTSPVRRGIYVLSRLQCSPPNPPPNDVPKFQEDPPGVPPNATMRQRLALHRTRPDCASCHNSIDPIGLGLENFDGIGRYRTMEAGMTIDIAGTLPDGTAFAGPAELASILKQPSRGFDTCMTRQMLTFMVGRGFQDVTGAAWSSRVADAAHASGGSFGALVANVVKSGAFTLRRGE
jgi:hypothetical protein